jgi:four helix bundle protein
MFTRQRFTLLLTKARGSLCELETQVELCRNLGFLDAEQSRPLLGDAAEIARMLNGLLRTIRDTAPPR